MSVDLVTQHAKRLHHIVLSGVACVSVCLSLSLYPVVTKYPTLYDMSLSLKRTIVTTKATKLTICIVISFTALKNV